MKLTIKAEGLSAEIEIREDVVNGCTSAIFCRAIDWLQYHLAEARAENATFGDGSCIDLTGNATYQCR